MTDRQAETDRWTDRQTRQTDRKAGRQEDRLEDRQTDRQTDMGTISIRKGTGNATFLSTPLKKERRRNDNLMRKR